MCRNRRRHVLGRARWLAAIAGCLAVVALGVVLVRSTTGDERGDLVGPDEFAARMGDPEAVVVNVHVPYEGEIPGTDVFIPFDEIASSDELPEDRERPLLLYCRTGSMSASAAADLVDAGYGDVTDLEGGMVAWRADGRTVEVDPQGT